MEAIFETNPVFLSSLLGDLKTGLRLNKPSDQITGPSWRSDGWARLDKHNALGQGFGVSSRAAMACDD